MHCADSLHVFGKSPHRDVFVSQRTAHKLDIACAEMGSTFSASPQRSVAQHMCDKSTQYS